MCCMFFLYQKQPYPGFPNTPPVNRLGMNPDERF